MNTIQTSRLLLLIGIAALSMATWRVGNEQLSPSHQTHLKTSHFGEVVVARPNSAITGLSLVFVDGQRYAADDLARRIALEGSAVAVIDTARALKALSTSCQDFRDGTAIGDPLNRLAAWAQTSSKLKRVVAGIGDGAWLAFLASQGGAADKTDYLSIDFSMNPPVGAEQCSPFGVQSQDHGSQASQKMPDQGRWLAVWTDQPPDATAIFVRSVVNAETVIAPYDTPLDQVAVEEITRLLGQSDSRAVTMPIVEVSSDHPNPTLTLFYSGDGGWRDLDRAVAQEMAHSGFSVAGVDVLRYFWEHKSPQQAASDLSATMMYYRKKLGIQSFVLAGYSFGADILPAVFNRLPKVDQDAVKLLVLLAAGEHADFEIHVTGWLGQQHGDMPLAPDLAKIPAEKIMCVYGREEKDHQGCKGLENSAAELLELPGGHHFDQDYPKLAQRIIEAYHRHALE